MSISIKIGAAFAVAATFCGSAAAAPLYYDEFSTSPGWAIYQHARVAAGGIDSAGIVHLRGGLHGHIGATASPFTLPVALRPNKDVYVPIDLVDGQPGRLAIHPNGVVVVQAPPSGDPLYFVSLEGVTYAKSAAPLQYTGLALINNWHPYSAATRAPAGALDASNTVHLKGAIHQSSGNDGHPFVLPLALRPNKIVYVPIDLINGNGGRLVIQPNGVVSEQAAGVFANAQFFTSLEGVTYPRSTTPFPFTPLTLTGGWKSYGDGTRYPSGGIDSDGIVHLKGGMYEPTGNSALPFTLPPELRPSGGDVFVRIGLIGGTVGRLNIHADGSVGLQSAGPFSDAQGFTSLDGVSYMKN
jgi:hypothetical protein